MNDQLKEEIPQFMTLKTQFFESAFEGIVKTQFKYHLSCKEALEGVKRGVDYGVADSRMEDSNVLLEQMRQLSICHS
jgi:hypothetical protein